MEQITSRQNNVIQYIRKLASDNTFRQQQGEFLCEGPKLWHEALSSRWPVKLVLSSKDKYLSEAETTANRIECIAPSLLDYVAATSTPQEPLFTCRLPENPHELPGKRLLVLDNVQDPGNVGTIWRTADALGADGLILLPGCASPWSPKTVRATMGACFRLPVLLLEVDELFNLLRQDKIPAYAASPGPENEDIRLSSTHNNSAALIIGSEGRGVSPSVLNHCKGRLTIPMRPRCESLNASIAAAIFLWEAWGRNA